MLKNIYQTLFILMICSINLFGQNGIDQVLIEVSKNNKTIIANQQYWETKKLLYKTDLTPDNPTIEYENLPGSPNNAGIQRDLFILQTIDFPTAYIKKKQVTTHQIEQDEYLELADKQNILLDTKLACIELIYLNKRKTVLNKRKALLRLIQDNISQKLAIGEANQLELNKVNLMLMGIELELLSVTEKFNNEQFKLSQLNGGNKVSFQDSLYPLAPSITDFSSIEEKIETNDPVIKSIQEQTHIDQKKLELTKALSLPRISGGYHSQSILGQRYQGVHVGVTVPLWESKNKIKHQKAHLKYNELEVDDHKTHHHFEIKQQFETYLNLKNSLQKLEELFATIQTEEMLIQALELGEISNQEFYIESIYINPILDTYMLKEKEYHQIIALLHKFEL